MPGLTIGGFYIKTYEATRSWGIEPASASGVGVVEGGGVPSIGAGSYVAYSILGVMFYGIVSSMERLRSIQEGDEWAFSIVDNRIRLRWAVVFGQWNMEEDDYNRSGGSDRGRYFRHISPSNWQSQRPTHTDSPKSAAQILDEAFSGAIGSYSFGINNHSSQSKPVMGVDANSGISLAALVSQIADAQGLQVTLDGDSTLRFERRGSGTVVIPANSHVQRMGDALSSEPTRVRVVGGRTLIQVNDVPFERDWRPEWESFAEETLWLEEVGAKFGPFPDTIAGRAEQAAIAREITVAQYAEESDSPDSYRDYGSWGRISRMNMPAWDYLNKIVFRCYRIPSNKSLMGIPMRELEIHDQLLCAAEISDDSTIFRSDPLEFYPQSAAFVIAKGQPLDMLASMDTEGFIPERVTNLRDTWTEMGDFNLDALSHSIIFSAPVFLDGDPAEDESLLLYVNKGQGGGADLSASLSPDSPYLQIVVPNPGYKISAAQVKASVVFRLGIFYKDYGSGTRWTTHQAPAIAWHLLYGTGGFSGGSAVASFTGSLGTPSSPAYPVKEIKYDDGSTALDQAENQSSGLIVRNGVETSGQFTRIGAAGTFLSGAMDRVTIRLTREEGLVETVEFSKPRPTRGFFSSKDIAARAQSDELYDGWQDLAREVRQYRAIARLDRVARGREKPRTASHQSMPDVFRKPFGCADTDVRAIPNPGLAFPEGRATWKAGDILWLDAQGKPSAMGSTFGGIVVMDSAGKHVSVATAGCVPVAVAPGTPPGAVGANPGDWKATASGSWPIGMLAHADSVPGEGDATLSLVRLGSGCAGGGPCYFGEIITWLEGTGEAAETKTGIRGGIIHCGDQNWAMDREEINMLVAGDWLIWIEVECVVNMDDDNEIFLPGVDTGTRPTGDFGDWKKAPWSYGTDYPDNTAPVVGTGEGTVILPVGKLTVTAPPEGSPPNTPGTARLDRAGCGHFTVTHCAGTLGYSRA